MRLIRGLAGALLITAVIGVSLYVMHLWSRGGIKAIIPPGQIQTSNVQPKFPLREITIIRPAVEEPVGGVVAIRIRVRTWKANLDTLVVKEREITRLHSSYWVEFQHGPPPAPVIEKTDPLTGIKTCVYRLYWDTKAVHNGSHALNVEGSFTLDESGEIRRESMELRPNLLNLVIVGCSPEAVVAWKGNMGETLPISVKVEDNNLRRAPIDLTLRLYKTDINNRTAWPAVRTLGAMKIAGDESPNSLTYTFRWSGKDDAGEYVKPGLYTYEVNVSQPGDQDSASYRSGRWDGKTYQPYLDLTHSGNSGRYPVYDVEFDGESDNGTPQDSSDDFFEYHIRIPILKDSFGLNASDGGIWMYDPQMNRVCTWKIASLPCLRHQEALDGLRTSKYGIRHDFMLRVPKRLMPPEGIYRFVLNIKDDHASEYRDHRSRSALNISADTSRYKIECFKKGRFYVVWCRAEAIDSVTKRVMDVGWKDPISGIFDSGMQHAPVRWVRDEPSIVQLSKRGTGHTAPVVFGTDRGEIRAAINGGFFAVPKYEPIGDVGSGFGWKYFCPTPRVKLWAFSMDAHGGGFAAAELEKSPIYSCTTMSKNINAWHATKTVREAYQYGRSPVGLLVKDGIAQEKPPWWPPIFPGTQILVSLPLKRTGIAFSEDVGGGKRHFFLVCSKASTWADFAYFFADDSGLAKIMRQALGKKNGEPVDLKVEMAFMLDGASSSQLAYRVKDSGGGLVRCPWDRSISYDILQTGGDKKMTDIVTLEATCQDVGNHTPKKAVEEEKDLIKHPFWQRLKLKK